MKADGGSDVALDQHPAWYKSDAFLLGIPGMITIFEVSAMLCWIFHKDCIIQHLGWW